MRSPGVITSIIGQAKAPRFTNRADDTFWGSIISNQGEMMLRPLGTSLASSLAILAAACSSSAADISEDQAGEAIAAVKRIEIWNL